MVLKRGFTLTEVLVVMSIVMIMIVIMVGIINPTALVDKGYDARKKKDILRIKVAFEEFFNDKGCFPTGYNFDTMTCNGGGFSPWLASWPCAPNGDKYKIIIENSQCPKYFKVYAQLENKADPDIPQGWYSMTKTIGDGTILNTQYNYGASSTNVNWHDQILDSICSLSTCSIKTASGCERSFMIGGQGCVGGSNCYANTNCDQLCQVECCGAGCN